MSALYDPTLLKVVLRNKYSEENFEINPDSLEGNVFMERDDGENVELEVSVVGKEIHVMPQEQYEEGRAYKLTFKKAIRKKDGKKLRRDYYMSFCVRNSTFVMLSKKPKSSRVSNELM